MTILDTLTDLLHVEAQLKALGARKTKLRDSLDAEARARWESDGAVPSWKVARLGSATLAGTDSTVVDVVDEDAFNEWAGNEHPDLVQAVVRLPLDVMVRLFLELDIVDTELSNAVRYEVSPALLTALAKDGASTPDGQLVTEDGAIVPGVKVVPKPPYLMVRLDPQAKNRALAEMAVEPQSVSVSPVVAS